MPHLFCSSIKPCSLSEDQLHGGTDLLPFPHVLDCGQFFMSIVSKGCIFTRVTAQWPPVVAGDGRRAGWSCAGVVKSCWCGCQLAKPAQQKAPGVDSITRAKLQLFGISVLLRTGSNDAAFYLLV